MHDEIVALATRLAQIERRLAGMLRHGTVHEVDARSGTVRLRVGGSDAEPVLSPAVPYAQTAGALKVHAPPSVGQQMTIVAPTGDPRQGVALPMTWSQTNPSPSDKSDENVVTFGDARFELRQGELIVKVPRILIECEGSTLELTGAGLKMRAPEYQFDT